MTTTYTPPVLSRGAGGPVLDDPVIATTANALSEVENMRKGMANRVRELTSLRVDPDDVLRGGGLTEDHPQVAALTAVRDAMAAQEKVMTLSLQKAVRSHPLGPWVKAQNGLGEKTIGRVLGVVGDPYWNVLHNRPRTVSELWAYCGLHVLDGEGARRKKGVKANWSTEAKTRVWNCVDPIIKNRNSPYRKTFDDRREHTAVTHPEWTPIHSLNDAKRIVMKAILRDLWCVARDIHEEQARYLADWKDD